MNLLLEAYLKYIQKGVINSNILQKWLKSYHGTPAELQKIINKRITILNSKQATITKLGAEKKLNSDKVSAMNNNIENSKKNWLKLYNEYIHRFKSIKK